MLSWAAKYGIEYSARRSLGYHVPKKDMMVKAYSRDFQAAPRRKLGTVLDAVTSNTSYPDATRSGYFKRKAEEVVGDAGVKQYIYGKLMKKLHARAAQGGRSLCGRADVSKPGFAVYEQFLGDVIVKIVCGHCLPGETVESAKPKG